MKRAIQPRLLGLEERNILPFKNRCSVSLPFKDFKGFKGLQGFFSFGQDKWVSSLLGLHGAKSLRAPAQFQAGQVHTARTYFVS